MVMNCGFVRLSKEWPVAPLKYLPDIRLRKFISEAIKPQQSHVPPEH
jgi:hypothetical protein